MLPLLLSLAQDWIALDAILDAPPLKGAVVGAYVSDREGRKLYERNADTLLVPASNQKVLTALYALSRVPSDDRPMTRFWREPDHVFVDAPGDPTVPRSSLDAARRALGAPIGLPVRVRQAYMPGIGPDWEYDDLPFRYAAPTYAFTFDLASFELRLEDGTLRLPPEQRLDVRVEGGSGPLRVVYVPIGRSLTLRGAGPRERRGLGRYAMAEPDAAAARLLGGEIVRVADAPPARKPDFVVTGPTLAERLRACLVDSDNVVAEHLLMAAALQEGPLPEDAYPTAAGRLRAFLTEEVGLSGDSVLPRDGSGLSRQNLVTARALVDSLRWADSQPFAPIFRRALPRGGEGTLRNRLRRNDFAGKTGTLNAVTSLSGYLTTVDGRRVVLGLIVNHSASSASSIRPILDRFVERLERAPPQ